MIGPPLISDQTANLLILFLFVLFVPFVTKKVNLPSILGYLVVGILIGPELFNLIPVSDNSVIYFFQNIGILFNMFIAGLEVDIEQFNKLRNQSLFFGLLTTVFPGVIAYFLTRIIFPQAGIAFALLIADIVFSHSSIAYAIVSELGVANDDSVVITVGATMLTDTLAFLVLGALIGFHSNGSNFSLASFGMVIFYIILFVIFSLILLPKIVKPIINIKKSTTVDFALSFTILLSMSILANLIGLAAIIGAFMAGLAINRSVSKESPLIHISSFTGRAIFIPIFFIYIGTLVNLGAFLSGTSIFIYSFIFLFSLIIGKFIASAIASRVFRFSFDQFMTSYSFTLNQAGGTLVTILIAVQYGMLQSSVINAGLVFVIITVFIGPVLTNIYGPKLSQTKKAKETQKDQNIFKKVLFPTQTFDDSFSNTISLIKTELQDANSILYPVTIIPHTEDVGKYSSEINVQESLDTFYKQTGLNHDQKLFSIQITKKYSSTINTGIILSSLEIHPTIIFLNWKKSSSESDYSFSKTIDLILRKNSFPIAIVRLLESVNDLNRCVLFISDYDLNSPNLDSFSYVCDRIAKSLNKPLIMIDISHQNELFVQTKIKRGITYSAMEYKKFPVVSARKLKNELRKGDFVIFSIPHAYFESSNEFSTSLTIQPVQVSHFNFLVKSNFSLMIMHFPILIH